MNEFEHLLVPLYTHCNIENIVNERGSSTSPSIYSASTTFTPLQKLKNNNDAILSVACWEGKLFAGSHNGLIDVWDFDTYTHEVSLEGHAGCVSYLLINEEKKLLFSSSNDGTVRVWDLTSLKLITVIFAGSEVGDIFCLTYSNEASVLYFGCQNGSIHWVNISEQPEKNVDKEKLISLSQTRFFSQEALDQLFSFMDNPDVLTYVTLGKNKKEFCHYGYIYALTTGILPCNQKEVVITGCFDLNLLFKSDINIINKGSGDGLIKIWLYSENTLELVKSLETSDGAVLSLFLSDELLYCGCQDGVVKIWDLDTFSIIRTVLNGHDDIVGVYNWEGCLITTSATGLLTKWCREFSVEESSSTQDPILCLTVHKGRLLTGSTNGVNIWLLESNYNRRRSRRFSCVDEMVQMVQQMIEYKTISVDPNLSEESRRSAKFLKNMLTKFGAEVEIVPNIEGKNPVVIGKFKGNEECSSPNTSRNCNVLFYGHYDVMPVNESKWLTPPFKCKGENGYLYGRGMTDNKGPVVAAIFAVRRLKEQKRLLGNICFVIEGEEENGSVGLIESIRLKKDFIGVIDVIVMSNSYWIADNIPSLAYGIRGAIAATIAVEGEQSDMNPSVYGGNVNEPMVELIKVLSSLLSMDRRIQITGFYDDVVPFNKEENQNYENLVRMIMEYQPKMISSAEEFKEHLISRWRNPSLTIHEIDSSAPSLGSLIPHIARARLTLKIVPNQDPAIVIEKMKHFLNEKFSELKSKNSLKLDIENVSNHWVGQTDSIFYQLAEEAMEEIWNKKPLLIREGGSWRALPLLQKEFNAELLLFPISQATDNAHLPNERMSVNNLSKGALALQKVFEKIVSVKASEVKSPLK